MILFHTSDRKIESHDIHYGRRNADFGWGFYLTPEKALQLLMIGPEYIQVAIKSEKAVKQLKWIKAEHIDHVDIEIQKAEQGSLLWLSCCLSLLALA